jgi:hypothetical protein
MTDNFKIHAYDEILSLENDTKKFIETVPDVFIARYFGDTYPSYNEIKQSGDTHIVNSAI